MSSLILELMIEAELKARVRDSQRVRADLDSRAPGIAATYRDTYYDRKGELAARDAELRLRQVELLGSLSCLLTYKDAADASSGSKPEYEIRVEDPATLDAILIGLGYEHIIEFEKHCVNFEITASGREMTNDGAGAGAGRPDLPGGRVPGRSR